MVNLASCLFAASGNGRGYFFLRRPTTLQSIHASSGFLSVTAGYSSQTSQFRHPLLCPKNIAEQARHIVAHIQPRPMQTRSSAEKLDFHELGGSGLIQALQVFARDRDHDAIRQTKADLIVFGIVSSARHALVVWRKPSRSPQGRINSRIGGNDFNGSIHASPPKARPARQNVQRLSSKQRACHFFWH